MTAITVLGTLASIWRYPVKGLAPDVLQNADVGADGLAGDRARALFVRTPDCPRTGKTYRGKENHLLHTVSSAEDAVALATRAGFDVDLESDGPFFDARPISIVFDLWVGDAETLVGYALDPLRYRPNLYVRAAPGIAVRETDLVGRTLGIGNVTLHVDSTIDRCVTTTYDVKTGEPDPAVLRAVAQHRNNVMGIYCEAARPGRINIGDTVTLLAD